MRNVGISIGYDDINEKIMRQMREAGITHVEISLAMVDYARLDYGEVARAAEKADIILWSWHLPFSPFKDIDISSLSEDVRVRTVDVLSTIMRRAAAIGIRRFVIHASGEPIEDDVRAARLARATLSLATLADVARELGALLAVEDLPRTCIGNCSDEVAMLIEKNETLGVCFDTNHLLHESAEDFLAKLGDRLLTVHVSDYDFVDERHLLPGEGKINWVSMMDTLDEAGYEGVFMYELGRGSTKRVSREVPLTFTDYYQNAVELHERKPLTIHPHKKLYE